MPIPGPDRSRARAARARRRAPTARSSWSACRRTQIRAALEAAGLEPKQAKLRAKQVWHWIYNRGVTDFAAMSDIAKAQRAWLAERFVDRAGPRWSRRRFRPTARANGC